MCHASYDPVRMMRDIDARMKGFAPLAAAAPDTAAAPVPGWWATIRRWFGRPDALAERPS
jgi:hypothetical protein